MMRIILEGPDLVGKTTLAQAIQDLTDAPIEHFGPPKRHPLYEYEPTTMPERVIYDRYHLGETIYGPLFRGASQLNTAQLHHVRMYLQARGALVVLCTAPPYHLMKRLRERGDDMLQSEDQLWHAMREYTVFASGPFVDRHCHTTTPSDHAKLIIANAEVQYANRQRPEIHPGLRTYVGPPRPKTLLVGDRRQQGDESEFTGAFVPMQSTSGYWLLNALVDDSFDLEKVGLINANESSPDDFYRAWCSLNRPRTVALGSNAKAKLEHLRIPHGAVAHPQYFRRFHYKHGRFYTEMLRAALATRQDLRDRRPRG